ncbi:hypothetical protein ACFX13_029032 [Malus domestica]
MGSTAAAATLSTPSTSLQSFVKILVPAAASTKKSITVAALSPSSAPYNLWCPKKFGSLIFMEEQRLPIVPNNGSEIHQRCKGGFRNEAIAATDVRERHQASLPNLFASYLSAQREPPNTTTSTTPTATTVTSSSDLQA